MSLYLDATSFLRPLVFTAAQISYVQIATRQDTLTLNHQSNNYTYHIHQASPSFVSNGSLPRQSPISPSLPSSLPPSVPYLTFPPFLPPSLRPLSLLPSLPPSLPKTPSSPSLPSSLPPSPISPFLPSSLPPSLSPSFLPSLSHSLLPPPSLPPPVLVRSL